MAKRRTRESGNFSGVKRRAGAAVWGGKSKGRGEQAFETRSQSIPQLAVDVRGPDLHQHVRASDRPAHLLALGQALADNRIHGRFRQGGSDAEPGSVALAVVDDRTAIGSDIR